MNRSQALLLVLGLLASAAQADIHPNTAPGFQPDQSFHVGDVDNVNLFNGSLTLTLPLGGTYPVNGGFSYGVKLTYNANDWDWIDGEYVDPEDPNHHIKTTAAFPGSCNNAGLGWRISFGRLDPPCQPPNPPFVFYQDENGTNHIFFETLHANDPEDASVSGISRILYTRDGSYLRLIVFNDGTREVESPDGTIRRFNGTGLPEHIRDRFGNKLNFFYGELHPTTHQPVWRLTDSQNRTHYIVFRNDFLSLWGEVVDRVELAAFGGATATYQFSYASADIGLPCPSAGAVGQTGKVFFLTSVALPDGSAWSMPLSDYITAPPPAGASCTDHAGNLIGLTLPTRGRLEWTWQEYKFHQGSSSKPRLQRNSGVAARTMRDIGGAVLGTWTYVSAPAVPLTSNEHTTTVIDPLGHKTVNYFSMAVVPNYTGWSYFDYSLPFTRNQTLNVAAGVDLNLSRQIYNAAGTLLRSEYVLYERDPVQFTSLPPENTNRRMLRSRTLYHDDPAVPYAGIVNSDFDGLGHYRIQQTEGNFSAGSNLRGRYATYNPLRGTYTVNQAANTGSGFSVFPPGSNWVLEAPTLSRDYENGTYSMTEYCYHPGTATVVRERIHRLNSPTPAASQSAQDLMVVHELRDALGVLAQGNVLADKFYGGDAQAGLATGVLDICTMALPPSPEYQINHTYVSGVRATSQYAGTGVVFLNNTVIDANTGLVATSKDLSDVGTGFEYDAMGRLTWVKPDAGHGGWTQYVYTPAAGSSRANVTIRRRDNGSKTAAILNASQIVFDGHGRVFQETRNLPGGTFNKRETVYDAAGNKASVSEWVTGTPTQKTLFSGYDPFGRPSTITPPDGVAHNVTMSYAGVRQVNRTVKIATAAGLNPATTTETYDRHGRLIQVTEPSGTADANVITSYGYDVGNRLISVSMPSQTRTFSYDRAGFLQSETHPELGVSGNGTTFYTRYDSRGHVLRKVDGNNSLTHVYDPAERLFQVKETTGAQRLLKTFSYANANGNYTDPLTGVVCFDYRKNKITQQSRYNYVTVVGSPFTVELREGMTYCGRDGRLSRRSLDNYVNGGATPSESFVLPSVAYDALGNVTTLGYPQCTHAACTAPAPRTVTFSYTEDLLSSVGILGNSGYYASSITYHPNLMVNQVVHNNNPADSTKRLTDTYAIDTNNMMRRPASITVTTPTGVARWSTGTYAYDGAGNISAIGPDTFNYDKVSRLKTANLYLEPTSSVTLRTQTYTYDVFGNIQSVGGNSARNTPTTATTNHLTSGAYDASGNLIGWNGNTYAYDPFNLMWNYRTLSDEWIYLYTAGDERAWSYKTDNTSLWTLRGPDNQVLREYSTSPSWNVASDYIYRGGSLLAAETPQGIRHFHLDHLGTPRLVSGNLGQQKAYHVYYPFGEEATAFNQDTIRAKFTGHERDLGNPGGAGDDLDYMHARHCSPLTGRFLAVDPADSAVLERAQTWNRYSYANDNPLKLIDPDGQKEQTPEPPSPNDPFGFVIDFLKRIGLNGSPPVIYKDGKFQQGAPTPGQLQKLAAAAVAIDTIARSALPSDAGKALGEIESGKDRPNAVNPKPFANDGRDGGQVLPKTDKEGNEISYTEHTVNPRQPGQPRDSKRLVTGSDGSVYYTEDHYKTFKKVEPAPKQ